MDPDPKWLWFEACREAGITDERAHAFLRQFSLTRVDGNNFDHSRLLRGEKAAEFHRNETRARLELSQFDANIHTALVESIGDSADATGTISRVAQRRLKLLEAVIACRDDRTAELHAAHIDFGYSEAADKTRIHMREFLFGVLQRYYRKRRFEETMRRYNEYVHEAAERKFHGHTHTRAHYPDAGRLRELDELALDHLGLSSWHIPTGYTGTCRVPAYTATVADDNDFYEAMRDAREMFARDEVRAGRTRP